MPFSIHRADLKQVKKNAAILEQAGITDTFPFIAGNLCQLPAAVLFQQDPRPEGTGRGGRRDRRRPDRHHRPRGAEHFLRQISDTPEHWPRPSHKALDDDLEDFLFAAFHRYQFRSRKRAGEESAPGPCWNSCACSSARTGSGWPTEGSGSRSGKKVVADDPRSPRHGAPGPASRAASTAAKPKERLLRVIDYKTGSAFTPKVRHAGDPLTWKNLNTREEANTWTP